MERIEIVLPRRVLPQPVPFVVDGGDCAACVLGSICGMSVREIYSEFANAIGGDRPHGLGFEDIRNVLHEAMARGIIDRFVVFQPMWFIPDGRCSFGVPGWNLKLQWFEYLLMAMDAGYYGLANVVFDKKGPFATPDHFVMIVGARMFVEDNAFKMQILVSCSSTKTPDVEWVNVDDFLKQRGGFNIIYARPKE